MFDDGEKFGGERVLRVLKENRAVDVLTVCCRWVSATLSLFVYGPLNPAVRRRHDWGVFRLSEDLTSDTDTISQYGSNTSPSRPKHRSTAY